MKKQSFLQAPMAIIRVSSGWGRTSSIFGDFYVKELQYNIS
jgi:hypothetical protein